MIRRFTGGERPKPTPDAQAANVAREERIAFRGFTSTSIVTGTFEIDADRLTDQLNGDESFVLTGVSTFDLDTLVEIALPTLVVSRRELLIVEIAGRRGSERRRFKTSPHGVNLTVGPYRIQGYIHAVPGVHPTSGIYHRATMVPITDAVVSYLVMGRQFEERLDAIDVNREALSSISLTKDQVAAHMRAVRGASTGAAPIATAPDPTEAGETVLEPSRRVRSVVADRQGRTPSYLPTPRYSRPPDR
jgi:hypothetical protein